MNADRFAGCLLGSTVGDALGLPYEGMRPRKAKRLFPDAAKHHFFFGRGMVSDDTEHACFVAQAIIRSQGDVDLFRRSLARSLRWWMLGLPAGIGFATLRSIIRLWFGVNPRRSGVFSAGNGPAMRAPVLGVAFGDDPDRLKEYVRASTRITHTDPKACYAALAVAIASRSATVANDWQTALQQTFRRMMPEPDAAEFHELIDRARSSADSGEPVARFAAAIGSKSGISGYCYHTVPCVMQVLFRYGDDFAGGLQELIECGGDTDTSGAIFGGIVGARAGRQAIPRDWLDGIIEWPRTVTWIERLGEALAGALDDPANARSPTVSWPAMLLRNLFFLVVVLAHGLRRLF